MVTVIDIFAIKFVLLCFTCRLTFPSYFLLYLCLSAVSEGTYNLYA